MNNRYAEMVEMSKRISEVGFYMDDLRLYLDTHPNCTEAIMLYNKYAEKYKDLKEKFNAMHGPLNYYQKNTDCNVWQWNSYGWPWKGVC